MFPSLLQRENNILQSFVLPGAWNGLHIGVGSGVGRTRSPPIGKEDCSFLRVHAPRLAVFPFFGLRFWCPLACGGVVHYATIHGNTLGVSVTF